MNTGAAEVLYSAVGEWAQLDQDSTLLDVCCGTGTIGISLAKVIWDVTLRSSFHCMTCFLPKCRLVIVSDFCVQRVKKVIGIEMCQEAVEDAKVNAKLNGKTGDDITSANDLQSQLL